MVQYVIFTKYFYDCWTVMQTNWLRLPGLRSSSNYKDPAESFNKILNGIHPRAEVDESIAILDVHLTRNDGKLSTKIYRK